MTLAIFRTEGNFSIEKDILKHHLIIEKCDFSVVLEFLQESCLDQMICVNQETML